ATRATTCTRSHAGDWGTTVDFDDSPEEAAFRARIRAWLAEHDPGLPASSTDDEYWARQAEWHCALFDAGFFALTWPKRYGGHELPPVYEVIVDEELAAAGAPPKMINGITSESGQVLFDGVRVPAANMIGEPGEGWALAMTVVSHEREPSELGYVARYSKVVKELESTVRSHPDRYRPDQVAAL